MNPDYTSVPCCECGGPLQQGDYGSVMTSTGFLCDECAAAQAKAESDAEQFKEWAASHPAAAARLRLKLWFGENRL